MITGQTMVRRALQETLLYRRCPEGQFRNSEGDCVPQLSSVRLLSIPETYAVQVYQLNVFNSWQLTSNNQYTNLFDANNAYNYLCTISRVFGRQLSGQFRTITRLFASTDNRNWRIVKECDSLF